MNEQKLQPITALKATMRQIVGDLDGKEWNADTCAAIAEQLRTHGYTIREPHEYTYSDPQHAQSIIEEGKRGERWHAEGNRVLDENRLEVATVNGQAEDNSDTELIALAPQMLAALRAILFQVVQGKVLERDACISQAREIIVALRHTSWGNRT